MKGLILLSFIFVIGCNQSRDRRTPLELKDNSTAVQNTINGSVNTNSGTSITNRVEDTSSLPQGFDHCRFGTSNFTKYDGFLGNIDLCQNTQNPLSVVIRTEQDFVERTICVVPTTRDQNGSSFYIGNAYCDVVNANTFYTMTLTVFQGYSSLPLNGAMVMYNDKLGDYEACIRAVQNKEQICESFRLNGGYLDFSFIGN